MNRLRTNLARSRFLLSDGMNAFAKATYKALADKSGGGNVALSPFSLHTALSMLFFGSPESSETHRELVRLLGMPTEHFMEYPYNFLTLAAKYDALQNSDKVKLQVANKMFVDDSFEPKQDFKDLLAVFYRSTVEEVDFGQANGARATQIINQFVRSKTQGKIPNLIQPGVLGDLTRLVLINAIYFKGNWKDQFEKHTTSAQPFTVGGTTFQYPHTMFRKGVYGVANMPDLDAQVLELPYEDESFRMLIFLPNSEDAGALRDVERRLPRANLSAIDSRMDYGQTRVFLPRFKVDSKAEMRQVLEKLGVKTLYTDADLTDISDEEELVVHAVIHQAEVEVNEKGSEAAAATAVVVGNRAATTSVVRPRVFRVDRPFLFMIQDKELNLPLFMGRVVDPSGQRRLQRSSNNQRRSRDTNCGEAAGEEGIKFPCQNRQAEADGDDSDQ